LKIFHKKEIFFQGRQMNLNKIDHCIDKIVWEGRNPTLKQIFK
jgi:hypothetical protein